MKIRIEILIYWAATIASVSTVVILAAILHETITLDHDEWTCTAFKDDPGNCVRYERREYAEFR